MDYKSTTKQRFAELQPGRDGRLQAQWQLTDTKLADAVTLSVPPMHAIPIIFVPGIMGSNLCESSSGSPVWLLNGIKDTPVDLVKFWLGKSAGFRQKILHPKRTRVYRLGNVPAGDAGRGLDQKTLIERGWGEVSEASYHKFLLWLDSKMNGDRNPANWSDFASPRLAQPATAAERLWSKLPPGIVMEMAGLPESGEAGRSPLPILSDELLRRARSSFPVYAFGYNWLDSNEVAAIALGKRVSEIIAENNIGQIKCEQVILITHSMGGLVSRACVKLPGMAGKILGIVHGVMPATGAAVAYRRCKVGMKDEDFAASLVIGVDGKEVSAVFAQSPGALQLLPSEQYGGGWLDVVGPAGEKLLELPMRDPYTEIYLQRGKWWSLINEEWLAPGGGLPITWSDFSLNIKKAQKFHAAIAGVYHHNTYCFYGGGGARSSFQKVRWRVRKGRHPISGVAPILAELVGSDYSVIRTDGSNALYVGGASVLVSSSRGDFARVEETSHWEIRAELQDSVGDGTVPESSGENPRMSGGRQILQQFRLPGVKHEPAYRDYPTARQVTYYAVTKLASMAVHS